MKLRLSSLVRAGGAGSAAAIGGRTSKRVRALLLAGSDVAARRIDPSGLQPLAVASSGELGAGSDVMATATGAASWAALNLLAEGVLRRLRVPGLLRGALLGGAVYVADVAVATGLAAKSEQAEAAVVSSRA